MTFVGSLALLALALLLPGASGAAGGTIRDLPRVLGAGSGILAKGLLDGWNVIANVLLPGAILKY